ncbi:MAG: hypothetical protein ACMXX9_01155 [Candidatus Woesearchaeota archaeon]
MKEYDLQKYLKSNELLNNKLEVYLKQKVLLKQKIDLEEIKGHLIKSEHNLRFSNTIKKEFLDWEIIAYYYSCYHAALALIKTKGYTSKNHLATLLILIKEYYGKELNDEDIQTIENVLDYEDLLFYIETKNKREQASYSTRTKFEDITKIRLNTTLFVNKIKRIIQEKFE